MTWLVAKTPAAVNDLIEHACYLGERNPSAAQQFLDAAEQTFDLLCTNPKIGELYPLKHRRLASIRVWRVRGFENYVVFYRIVLRNVEVLRVLHGARDIASILHAPE